VSTDEDGCIGIGELEVRVGSEVVKGDRREGWK
jgi:hypothetical protein